MEQYSEVQVEDQKNWAQTRESIPDFYDEQ